MRRRSIVSRKKRDLVRRGLSFLKRHFWGISGLFLLGLAWSIYQWHLFFLDNAKLVPDTGGIYSEAVVGRIQNLNPLAPNTSLIDRDIQRLIFTGLLQYNPVKKEVESALADLRTGDDGRSYDLTLKPLAKFSDGSSVRVEDVLFTYKDLIQNPNFPNKGLKEAFEYVRITVVGADTIRFELPEQNVLFPALLTTPILPKSAFKDFFIEELTDPDYPFNKQPIGTGPFVIKNIVPGENGELRVFLKKNPYFYDKKPLLDQIVFYLYPTTEKLVNNHKFPTAFAHIPFRIFDHFEESLFEEYEPYEFVLPQFTGVFFNLDREIPRHLYLRKALYLASGVDKLIDEAWQRINGPLFFEDIETSYQSDDFAAARKLLRDFGFPFDKRKEVRTYGKKGEPIKLTMLTSTAPAVYSQMAQKLKKTWEKELDIEIDLVILSPDEFVKQLADRNYDMVLYGQNFTQNFDTLSLWHSSQSGKLNLANITRDDIDLAISEIRFSGAVSDKRAFSDRLDQLRPAIIFTTPKHKILVKKSLHNFAPNFGKIRSHADRFYGINSWYFNEKRAWDWSDSDSKIWGFLEWLFSPEPAKVEPDGTKDIPEAPAGPTSETPSL